MSVNRIFTTFSVSTSKLLSSPNTFSSQNSNKLSYSDNQAIAHLTDRFRTDIADKPASLANILNKILQEQPLEKTQKKEFVNLAVKYPKSADEMTIADYKTAVLRAEYTQAGYAMLTDAEIMMSEAAFESKGFTREWHGFENLQELQDYQRSGGTFTTEKAMLERDVRGGQAVLQYQKAKAEEEALAKLKAENEVNQMFVDQARVLYNSGVNIVEGTINMTIDAALSNGGRNPMVLSDPTRPQVDFSGAKSDYRSQMMRRNLEGKVDGEGIKRGEFMGLVIKSNLRN
jgi:hypothetical protein